MFRRNFILAGALAFASLGTVAPAQDAAASATPEAAAPALPGSLTRMMQAFQQPFECDMAMSMEADDGVAKATGSVAMFSPRQFRVHVDLKTYEGGEVAETFQLLVVADDEYLNIEATSEDEGKQAFKLQLDVFEQLSGMAEEMASGIDVNGMNPFDIASTLSQFEFHEKKLDDGGMRVHTTFTEFADQQLPGPVTLALDLHSETYFPKAFTVDAGELAQASITTSAVKFPEEMDVARFQYTPDGVTVMDLTGLLQMQLGSMMEDEDEF